MTRATPLTEERFLALLQASPLRLELLHGRIFAMAGAHPRHGRAASNLARAVEGGLGDPGCHALTEGTAVVMPDTYQPAKRPKRSRSARARLAVEYVFPDVVVFCAGARFRKEHPYALENPTLLAEVLSRSTSDRDETDKLASYKELPSLQHYLIVHLVVPRVDVWTRGPTGWTQVTVEQEGSLTLFGGRVVIPLSTIYARLEELPPLPD